MDNALPLAFDTKGSCSNPSENQEYITFVALFDAQKGKEMVRLLLEYN